MASEAMREGSIPSKTTTKLTHCVALLEERTAVEDDGSIKKFMPPGGWADAIKDQKYITTPAKKFKQPNPAEKYKSVLPLGWADTPPTSAKKTEPGVGVGWTDSQIKALAHQDTLFEAAPLKSWFTLPIRIWEDPKSFNVNVEVSFGPQLVYGYVIPQILLKSTAYPYTLRMSFLRLAKLHAKRTGDSWYAENVPSLDQLLELYKSGGTKVGPKGPKILTEGQKRAESTSRWAGSIPGIYSVEPCPAKDDTDQLEECSVPSGKIYSLIQHLNDWHQWEPVRVADWLDSLPYDLTIPEPSEEEKNSVEHH